MSKLINYFLQLSDLKTSGHRDAREDNPEATHFNEQLQSFPRFRNPNRYTESNEDQQEATEHIRDRDVYKANHILQGQGENQVNKRTVQFEGQTNEEGDMLFEKNRDQVSKVNRNENNNNEASDTNEQSRYFKQYYNTLQSENRVINEDKGYDGEARYNLRDRRDIKEAKPADMPTVSNSQDNKDSNDKPDSEDEESAIKRHIKKLSGDELNQLLNSLTDDRRELLKKIIDDVDSDDPAFINKREITKKAGAVEENNLIENCQFDLSKVQGGSQVVELTTEAVPSPNSETTDASKQPEGPTESNELSSQKTAFTSIESVNKMELTNSNDESLVKPADNLNAFNLNLDSKNQGKASANPQVSSKTEIKREANIDNMPADESKTIDNDVGVQNGQDYANDQEYYNSQDESSSKLLNDDRQLQEDGKEYKREVDLEKQSDLTDSMKSLEDSFPNSNAYDDSAPYSGPLVRVKRKNIDQVIKKRSAGLFPDAKVGYFPYKAENEDEDNDEGNEFDDEGFYDRNTNFANSNRGLEEENASADQSVQAKNSNVDNSKAAPHENLESEDSMSLGSDTDGVLSGVEGVDDNLMYSGDIRNRRGAEDSSRDTAKDESERSTLLLDNEKKSAGENYFNAPHYQDNDAFGPLPRNYDGDLNRYKRIRQVKQSNNDQEPIASDG